MLVELKLISRDIRVSCQRWSVIFGEASSWREIARAVSTTGEVRRLFITLLRKSICAPMHRCIRLEVLKLSAEQWDEGI
jgi:hypothetical protein